MPSLFDQLLRQRCLHAFAKQSARILMDRRTDVARFRQGSLRDIARTGSHRRRKPLVARVLPHLTTELVPERRDAVTPPLGPPPRGSIHAPAGTSPRPRSPLG